MDFSHSHECSLFSSINVLRDFILGLWVWESEPKFSTAKPSSPLPLHKKTSLWPLTETWVAALAGDTNCLMRCPCAVWSIGSLRVRHRIFSVSPLKLTHFLDKCRGHGGQSKKQGELVSRNIFYSWEKYIRGNWAWLSFVTGMKWEALESWHSVKMPFMSCAVCTLLCTLRETVWFNYEFVYELQCVHIYGNSSKWDTW